MKIIVFSNNQSKIQEINAIFAVLCCAVVSYLQVFAEPIEVVEDGATFAENAIKKVRALPSNLHHIYLADDSGLEVASLGGAPGIHSARYAGSDTTPQALCQKLLAELGEQTQRQAQFTTVIALRFPDETIEVVQGQIKGQITHEMCGHRGFGYDAVFQPHGQTQTFAELTAATKNQMSHRFLALVQAKERIRRYLQG